MGSTPKWSTIFGVLMIFMDMNKSELKKLIKEVIDENAVDGGTFPEIMELRNTILQALDTFDDVTQHLQSRQEVNYKKSLGILFNQLVKAARLAKNNAK
jgi:hypothetical protein